MNKVVSFSGGRTSAYLVHLMRDDPEAHFVFMDTGAEHPATYQFIRDIVKHWNINLVCLRVVYNETLGKGNDYKVISVEDISCDLEPWLGMVKKYGNPAVNVPFCTDRMKTKPFLKYCNDTFGKGNYERWLGIRADEPRRLHERDGFKYLANISYFEKQDILDWWAEQPFNLMIDEHLGNCVFCVKKSLGKVALATRDYNPIPFIELVEGDQVRTDGRKIDKLHMYRNRNSLSGIIELYKDYTDEEILSKLKMTKSFDTNSCSESCEVFGVEDE